VYTPSTPPTLYSLARGIVAHQSDASERSAMPRVGCYGGISAVGGHGCDGDSLPEHKPLFPVEPWHSGYRQKALVSSNTILALYRGGDVEIKEKRR
jgi:hypothetical protein